MRCGLPTAEDCAITHWCPVLGGRREPVGWRAPCPVCRASRTLEFDAPGRSIRWNLFCPCDRSVVRKALLDLLPGCLGRPSQSQRADTASMAALLLDKSVTVNALRLGCLRALGMTEQEIREKLAMPRQTYYDAVRILGQKRRSI